MKLLDPLAYRRLADGAKPVEAAPEAIARVVAYAQRVLPKLGLDERPLKPRDVARVTRGEATLFHVRAYPRRAPETFVIVAARDDGRAVQGHILVDLAAHDEVRLYSPSADLDEPVTPARAAKLVRDVHAGLHDPFAVLSVADGTYIQTYAERDGYVLEHQLVTTASHYEAPSLVSLDTVAAAFESYAKSRGALGGAWLELVPWRRKRL